jgi:hypothetical protein
MLVPGKGILWFQQVGRATQVLPRLKAGLLRADSFCLAEKIFGSRWDRMFYKSKKKM